MGGAKKFDTELFFSALADRTRLRLINLMGPDEVCVCFFVEILGRRSRRFLTTWPTCGGEGLQYEIECLCGSVRP